MWHSVVWSDQQAGNGLGVGLDDLGDLFSPSDSVIYSVLKAIIKISKRNADINLQY